MKDTNFNYVGQKYTTNEGYIAEVIEYVNRSNVTIRLNDGTVLKRRIDVIKNGQVKNPNHKSIYGVGYIGEGDYTPSKNGVHTQAYRMWKNVLNRCYNEKYLLKRPTYEGCAVCEDWHNFQNFAKWYDDNYYEVENQEMHLDKDIIQKGNKVYNPETSVFVPEHINSLFTKRDRKRGKYPIGVHYTSRGNKFISQCMSDGEKIYLGRYNTPEEAFEKYKIFKEEEIKRVADKYKDFIPTKLYKALYSYKVDIND